MKILTSSTPVLRPMSIYDIKTGEKVSLNDLQVSIEKLISSVQSQSQQILGSQWDKLVIDCESYPGVRPEGYARQKGYVPPIGVLPREVKAKSRVQRLVGYSLITAVSGYLKNPNPRKQKPNIGKAVNLGAVDSQMATLSYDESENILTLRFKCWEQDYLIEFAIPHTSIKEL